MNCRLKILINKINFDYCNRNASVNHELYCKSKKYFVILYIHKISETTTSLINKSEFIVGFKGINKLNNFINVQKDKSNYIY